MSTYRPSELKAKLQEWGVVAKRSLSQNFLIDQNIILKILQLAKVEENDHVIEIGPGPGALTEALLKKGAHVVAIEMDSVFAKALERLRDYGPSLEIKPFDFLKFPLEEFLSNHVTTPFKVVANLPYHITTPILVRLLPLFPAISSVTVMVQKEFADRMIASSRSKDYSHFTLFCQFYAEISERFLVRPNSFYPRPKVHSSVVHCKLHAPFADVPIESFFLLTRTAFQQKRKMLRASLKGLFAKEKIEEALIKMQKPLETRPEEMTLQEWVNLFYLLN